MNLTIFDVEHGACSLLTFDDNSRLMIDCGHNTTTGWRPGSYLNSIGVGHLDGLVITNYDEDHVSGIENLFRSVNVGTLWRNKTVGANDIRYLKSETGMRGGIDYLCNTVIPIFTGPPIDQNKTFIGASAFDVFYNNYPTFDDENNLSVVFSLRCHGVRVLFPGDIEGAGWRALLPDPSFQQVLRETRVLIASHHGRESGWCEELRPYLNPHYVVISDQGYQYATQETVPLYRSIARGGPFRGADPRHVLTTRSDGAINFQFTAANWYPY